MFVRNVFYMYMFMSILRLNNVHCQRVTPQESVAIGQAIRKAVEDILTSTQPTNMNRASQDPLVGKKVCFSKDAK